MVPSSIFFRFVCVFRFDEEVGRVELDYPRDMSMWRGIGYHIDTAFQYQGMVFCSYTKNKYILFKL